MSRHGFWYDCAVVVCFGPFASRARHRSSHVIFKQPPDQGTRYEMVAGQEKEAIPEIIELLEWNRNLTDAACLHATGVLQGLEAPARGSRLSASANPYPPPVYVYCPPQFLPAAILQALYWQVSNLGTIHLQNLGYIDNSWSHLYRLLFPLQ